MTDLKVENSKEMLTELKMTNHKFDDDAVAEENYYWGLVAPPPAACGSKWSLNWEKLNLRIFYLMEQ